MKRITIDRKNQNSKKVKTGLLFIPVSITPLIDHSNKTEKSWSGISPFFLYYRDDTIYSIASVSITNFTFPSIPLSFPLNVV